MKYLNTGTLSGFALGLLLAVGIVYAAQNITSLSQTAQTGDKITAAWVNEVNTKLNNLSTGGPGTVIAGCWRSNQTSQCWGGASIYALSNMCPSGSTVRGVGWIYGGGEAGDPVMGSFICVKN